MPSPYDDIIGRDAQQWRREIEERQIHTSIYTDRHGADDPPTPPVVRIDTTEIIPTKFTEVATPTYVEQPFPSAVTPCPTTSMTVQFAGVSFGCGCSLFSEGAGGSFLITDEGDTNSFITPMGFGATTGCSECKGFSGSGSGLSPHVLISFWNEDPGCSGGPTGTDFPEYFGLIMVRISGIYYLVAYILQSLIFYGSTTSLSLPIVNLLSCDLSFHHYSDDPISCLFEGILSPVFNSIGQGGVAIVVT